jgi:hypothetical protein
MPIRVEFTKFLIPFQSHHKWDEIRILLSNANQLIFLN